MWIRFWFKSNSREDDESSYEWLDSDSSDLCLEDCARERVPEWLKENFFYFGFERIDKPPLEILQKLHVQHKQMLAYTNHMIGIISKQIEVSENKIGN